MSVVSRRSRPLAHLSLVTGFGLSWAVGLSVVFFIGSSSGWGVLGAMQGLTLASLSRTFQPSVETPRLLILVSGWTLGGALAIPVANYEIWRGWLIVGTIGGIVTWFTFADPDSGSRAFSAITITACWLLSGLIGTTFGSTGGKLIGAQLAGGTGRYAPFMVWAIAWGIGGGITGLIGFVGTRWLSAIQARST